MSEDNKDLEELCWLNQLNDHIQDSPEVDAEAAKTAIDRARRQIVTRMKTDIARDDARDAARYRRIREIAERCHETGDMGICWTKPGDTVDPSTDYGAVLDAMYDASEAGA